MDKIKFLTKPSHISLSYNFLDKYLLTAPPIYILIYMYCLQNESHKPDTSEISKKFKLMETDVLNAFAFWEAEGLIEMPTPPVTANDIKACDIKINMETKPVYSTDEISTYIERSPEIKSLFKKTESILARPLNYNDLNLALTFYEWYMLPVEVIETLLEYCVSVSKTGGRYMETVARDWSENGINTKEKAMWHCSLMKGGYREIMKALGLSDRTPNKKQIEFMNRWLNVMNINLELVLEACERAVMNTGKARFEYVETILTDWHKHGANTLNDVKKIDEIFKDSKVAQESKPKKSKNNFNNFEQREWDFDKIEKMAMTID